MEGWCGREGRGRGRTGSLGVAFGGGKGRGRRQAFCVVDLVLAPARGVRRMGWWDEADGPDGEFAGFGFPPRGAAGFLVVVSCARVLPLPLFLLLLLCLLWLGFFLVVASIRLRPADAGVDDPVPAAGVVGVELVFEGDALLGYEDGFADGHCFFEGLGDGGRGRG